MLTPLSTALLLAGLSLCNIVAHMRMHSKAKAAQLLARGLMLQEEVPVLTHLHEQVQQYCKASAQHQDDPVPAFAGAYIRQVGAGGEAHQLMQDL